MNDDIDLVYDPATKTGLLTFPGGRQLKVSGVTEEKAREFKAKHAREFQRRDFQLTTAGVIQTREGGSHD